eukprot:GHVT01044444.1.p1 GENE.GHVT01044444.1~~GHVT01044444.1.p1  ORF type:complete len:1367 (-),score=279.27 GHVT01044444.1:4921-9021(-)
MKRLSRVLAYGLAGLLGSVLRLAPWSGGVVVCGAGKGCSIGPLVVDAGLLQPLNGLRPGGAIEDDAEERRRPNSSHASVDAKPLGPKTRLGEPEEAHDESERTDSGKKKPQPSWRQALERWHHSNAEEDRSAPEADEEQAPTRPRKVKQHANNERNDSEEENGGPRRGPKVAKAPEHDDSRRASIAHRNSTAGRKVQEDTEHGRAQGNDRRTQSTISESRARVKENQERIRHERRQKLAEAVAQEEEPADDATEVARRGRFRKDPDAGPEDSEDTREEAPVQKRVRGQRPADEASSRAEDLHAHRKATPNDHQQTHSLLSGPPHDTQDIATVMLRDTLPSSHDSSLTQGLPLFLAESSLASLVPPTDGAGTARTVGRRPEIASVIEASPSVTEAVLSSSASGSLPSAPGDVTLAALPSASPWAPSALLGANSRLVFPSQLFRVAIAAVPTGDEAQVHGTANHIGATLDPSDVYQLVLERVESRRVAGPKRRLAAAEPSKAIDNKHLRLSRQNGQTEGKDAVLPAFESGRLARSLGLAKKHSVIKKSKYHHHVHKPHYHGRYLLESDARSLGLAKKHVLKKSKYHHHVYKPHYHGRYLLESGEQEKLAKAEVVLPGLPRLLQLLRPGRETSRPRSARTTTNQRKPLAARDGRDGELLKLFSRSAPASDRPRHSRAASQPRSSLPHPLARATPRGVRKLQQANADETGHQSRRQSSTRMRQQDRTQRERTHSEHHTPRDRSHAERPLRQQLSRHSSGAGDRRVQQREEQEREEQEREREERERKERRERNAAEREERKKLQEEKKKQQEERERAEEADKQEQQERRKRERNSSDAHGRHSSPLSALLAQRHLQEAVKEPSTDVVAPSPEISLYDQIVQDFAAPLPPSSPKAPLVSDRLEAAAPKDLIDQLAEDAEKLKQLRVEQRAARQRDEDKRKMEIGEVLDQIAALGSNEGSNLKLPAANDLLKNLLAEETEKLLEKIAERKAAHQVGRKQPPASLQEIVLRLKKDAAKKKPALIPKRANGQVEKVEKVPVEAAGQLFDEWMEDGPSSPPPAERRMLQEDSPVTPVGRAVASDTAAPAAAVGRPGVPPGNHIVSPVGLGLPGPSRLALPQLDDLSRLPRAGRLGGSGLGVDDRRDRQESERRERQERLQEIERERKERQAEREDRERERRDSQELERLARQDQEKERQRRQAEKERERQARRDDQERERRERHEQQEHDRQTRQDELESERRARKERSSRPSGRVGGQHDRIGFPPALNLPHSGLNLPHPGSFPRGLQRSWSSTPAGPPRSVRGATDFHAVAHDRSQRLRRRRRDTSQMIAAYSERSDTPTQSITGEPQWHEGEVSRAYTESPPDQTSESRVKIE